MQDKIGEIYAGTVAGVTAFGIFVALDGVYVEGLVHVTELGNDYFNYDKARHEMLGERTGARFRLGDRLTVKVARVDLETIKIDFILASAVEAAANLGDKNNILQSGSNTINDDATISTIGLRADKVNKTRLAVDYKPLSSRALDRAKKDRTGAKKLGKSPVKNATRPISKSATQPTSKNRERNTKNKGKR